jgi:hypothetical protein
VKWLLEMILPNGKFLSAFMGHHICCVTGQLNGTRDVWRSAEGRREDKQDGVFIAFHRP